MTRFLTYSPLYIAAAVSAMPLLPSVWALQSDSALSATPFSDPARFQHMQQQLPTLGDSGSDDAWAKRLATMAKAIGEASLQASDSFSLGDQAGIWAFNRFRDEVSTRATRSGEDILSPYGNATLNIAFDRDGNFNGTGGQLFTPWQDRYDYLTFTQLGVKEQNDRMIANLGIGQRWIADDWLLGYNAFIDQSVQDNAQRASLGAEAWGNFLRFSANYYHPLSGWHASTPTQQQRMARGYDITTQSYLPFYRQLGVSFSYEQYLGDNVDLFNSGNRYRNPSAVKVGLSYTPVPLVTFTASHKEAEGGESQEQLGLKLNYRLGVALSQQLSADNVAVARSLRGSRYDTVERNTTPVMAFRQRKALSVFLATPPWQLQPGETLPLKLQIRNSAQIVKVSWQGDTQALSLTPPANNDDPQGWTVIMPPWDNASDASNTYRLSVTLEDNQQRRVTSNWITLKLAAPVSVEDTRYEHFDVMAP